MTAFNEQDEIAAVCEAFLALLPDEEGGLYLEHNPHHGVYEPLAEYAASRWEDPADDPWVSPEDKERAIATDNVWMLQWYPTTPIGFNVVVASDLVVLLRAVFAERRRA